MDLVTVIDACPKPAFLVDSGSLLRHTNAPGQKALHREDYLRLRDGRVIPADPERGRPFTRLVGTATLQAGPEVSRNALLLFDTQGISAVLFVHSIGKLPPVRVDDSRAVLLLSAQARDQEIDAIRLRITFGFTSAEDRLVRDLIRGNSLKETSEKYRLGRETLKSQLASLFRKTGTHRQGELVALLLAFLSTPPAPGRLRRRF